MHVAHVELLLPRQGVRAPAAELSHLIAPVVGERQQHVVDVLVLQPLPQRLEEGGLQVGAGMEDAAAVGLIQPPPAVAVALQALLETWHLQISLREQAAEGDGLLQGSVAVQMLLEPAGAAAVADRGQQLAV